MNADKVPAQGGGGGGRGGGGGAGAVPGRQSGQRQSARTWSDVQMQGSKRSTELNDLVCRCCVCGVTVSWGGSEAAAAG